MKIYHIAAEMAPFAKQGGLADVVAGLTKSCIRQGVDVEVILPHYRFLTIPFDRHKTHTFSFHRGGKSYKITVNRALIDDVPVNCIECSTTPYFDRDRPYGTPGEQMKSFLFFCIAAMAYIEHQHASAIVHLHDWPVALIAALAKTEKHPTIHASIFTIHNLQFQGECLEKDLAAFGIKATKELQLDNPKDPTKLNLMASAISHADHITTVSRTYAEEIQTSEYGWWLQDLLRGHRSKLTGIVNGIDTDYWNPGSDPHIHSQFAARSPHLEVIKAKHDNKRALQKELGLPHVHSPLICSITRLTTQKSPDLILHAMEKCCEIGMQFALVGSEAPKELAARFQSLAKKPNISVELSFNPRLSHLLYGGADAIFIPSRFEPCGLTQLIAMRYGTIPIVRSTGGLKDTVEDIEYGEHKNGFVFEHADTQAVDWVLERVYQTYTNAPGIWEKTLFTDLSLDFSWDNSSLQYINIYKTLEN